ncbi:MAG: ABC transporter substrate-binding protein [Burkholderiales bacterium]|nr:ABC transporter substrate-binding protein [Burkholderiales bacterium]
MKRTGRWGAAVRAAAALALGFIAAAAAAADMNKVLRISFNAGETGFDPIRVTDTYSNGVTEQIYEPLLTYDYLARPARLVPMTAAAMPQVTDNGKTWLIRLKKGIVFQADPAFKGKKRELTVNDYIYAFKRLMDPKVRSPWQFVLEKKIVGLDALADQARKSGAFDYEAKVAGLEVLDSHSLRIRLNDTDYNFGYILAMPATSAQAREVVDAYEDSNAHPVGTGPYVLKKWVRGSKIVLEANPDYRQQIWDFQPGADPADKKLVAEMKGKKIPQIGVIDISIMEEGQSRWLAFQDGQLDYLNIPQEYTPKALVGDKLAPDLAKQGLRLQRVIDPDLTYTAFNIKDPVVGGFTKERVALRRAIVMAFDTDEEIKVVRRGQAIAARTPIPPGVVGYNPKYQTAFKFDPVLANRLLDQVGYKKGSDGLRMQPDGKPLLLRMATETNAIDRDFNELWKKSMDRIGIRIEFVPQKFSDNYRAAKACQLMVWGQAWIADYPDGENFMQLLYGPNTGQSNNGCYQSAAFDKLFAAAKKLPDSPERNKLYDQMSRQMEVDAAWRLGVHRIRNQIIRPEVKGFKKHPVLLYEVKYLDVVR